MCLLTLHFELNVTYTYVVRSMGEENIQLIASIAPGIHKNDSQGVTQAAW